MKYLKSIERLAILNQQNRNVLLNSERRRFYVSQTNQDDKKLIDISSKKLETPPIISFSGIYRCSVDNPVSQFLNQTYKLRISPTLVVET
jgi:hypothetical protein